jgi:peptide/nickel transport system substrate-binding protein
MKKYLFGIIGIIILVSILVGCGESTPTQTQTPTTTSETPTTPTTASEPAPGEPQYGGTLRAIYTVGLTNCGYPPDEGGFAHAQEMTRKLVSWDTEGNLVPHLAESWDLDQVNNALTWHLRKGVQFTDGTDFNADAAKWCIDRMKELGRLTEADKVISMDVLDDYTLRMNLTELTSQAAINYGWVNMYSPTAFKTNGEEWASSHVVGVGPFEVVNFSTDNFLDLKKYDDFYIEGTPYLDGMNLRVIPDSVSAAAMMEAGQADLWFGTPIKDAVELENKGFKVNWAVTGFFWGLFANSANPDSKWADKRLREAIEYAIDRPAMSKTLGYGRFEPLTQMAPKNSTGYNEGYDPRPHNPEKAKQLLIEAGYPDGFQTEIICDSRSQDYATAIQAYLLAVGIEAKIDLADFARYNESFMSAFFGGEGFQELVIGMTGIDLPFATGLLRHFGPYPMTGIVNINGAKSPEFLALCDKLYQTYDTDELTKVTKEAVKQAEEDALVMPLFRQPWSSVLQPNVHDDSHTAHDVVWNTHLSWIEKK